MGMTIEGCIRKPTKRNGEKIAAVDPGRIDSYNTSNVSLETARGGADTNRTLPADRSPGSRTRTQHHPEIESRLNSAAPRCREWIHADCVGELESRAQWAQWNASLLSNSSLLCFGFFIYVSFVSSHLSSAPYLLAQRSDTRSSPSPPLPPPSTSRSHWCCTYVCVRTRRDLVKHTSAIHHSIREPLCRDKRFCVPEELTSTRKCNVKYSCNSR